MKGVVSINPECATRSLEFAMLARSLMLARGKIADSVAHAEMLGASARVGDILSKTATAGSLSDANWASSIAPYQQLVASFVETMRQTSALDRMYPDCFRVPVRHRVGTVAAGVQGGIVDEADPKPIGELQLAVPEVDVQKGTATLVLSEDLLRLAGPTAQQLILSELRKGLTAATNVGLVAAVDVAGVGDVQATGPDADSVMADIGELLAATETGEASHLYLIGSAANAKGAATLAGASGFAFPTMGPNGGTLANIPYLVADAAGTDVFLVDAAALAVDLWTIVLDASNEATLDMAGGSNPTLSLFQKNLRALRAERVFGVQLLRTSAAAKLSGASWGNQNSASA